MRAVDCRSPHLPSIDQRSSDQQLDQLQVEGTLSLEGRQLLKVVQLAVQDVCLRGISRNVGGEGLRKFVCRVEPSNQSACLDKRVLVPAAKELGGQLGLAASANLLYLLRGEDRRAEGPHDAKRQDRGRDRGDLVPVDRGD